MTDAQAPPKVSVCVITYNHVTYIGECLQSLVSQKTNFDYEIIVGDDCSTDGTRQIVESFAARYPHLFRLLLHPKNVGGVENYVQVHALATGEFIAHLDGDDFALPGKLQAQVDFLDSHPDCQIVWHRMYSILGPDEQIFEDNFKKIGLLSKQLDINDLIINITLGLHSSKMCRRLVAPLPSVGIDVLDFSENVLLLWITGGKGCFIGDAILGCYRAGQGVSRNTRFIRVLIYQWLHYFFVKGIGDRRVISAKVFWMLVSDVRYRVGSFFTGLMIFVKMIRDFRLEWVVNVRRGTFPSVNMYKSLEKGE